MVYDVCCLQKSQKFSIKKIYIALCYMLMTWSTMKIKSKMFMNAHQFFIFQDKSISTSLPVLDLIDAIAPNAVRQEMIKREDLSEEDKLNNAK